MTKIVINACHGGFGLSHEGILAYLERSGQQVWVEVNEKYGKLIPFTYHLVSPENRVEGTPDNWNDMTQDQRQAHHAAYSETVFYDRDLARDDPCLVQVVEQLGAVASGRHAELKIVDVPDDVNWYIEEYDGAEWVAERHRTWE
jgi:hypothetical protein